MTTDNRNVSRAAGILKNSEADGYTFKCNLDAPLGEFNLYALPEGYMIARTIPNDEMISAGRAACESYETGDDEYGVYGAIYKAMLKAYQPDKQEEK